MTDFLARATRPVLAATAAAVLLLALPADSLAQRRTSAADRALARNGDYIVAVINQELVTAVEVERRLDRIRADAARGNVRLPPEPELRQQIVDALIEERVVLTYARETSLKIDEAEIDRAVQAVAAQNQITVEQLRERLRAEGVEFPRFRNNLRDQLMIERTREREVYQRIRVSDADIDKVLDEQRSASAAEAEINVAQILVTVPEGASDSVVAERRARAEAALTRVRAGEAFDRVAQQVSEDNNRERGGEIGLRPASRLPDLFIDATRTLKTGDVTPTLIRSGAGFHVLKVLDRREGAALRVTQTRARHILLRPSAQLSQDQAIARLAGYRRLIDAGTSSFEQMAREFSEDGSAPQGGDLGWASPGTMVPEFEDAMNRLPAGGLSQPVVSRFGVHLIQVLDRRQVEVDPKQLREQARNTAREQKFEPAYLEWVRDLRARAYVELREPPL